MKQWKHLNCKQTKGATITLNGPAGTFQGKCGATFEYLGHRFAITKSPNQQLWTVSEVTTGFRCFGGGTTIHWAIAEFIRICAAKGLTTEDFSKAISQKEKINN